MPEEKANLAHPLVTRGTLWRWALLGLICVVIISAQMQWRWAMARWESAARAVQTLDAGAVERARGLRQRVENDRFFPSGVPTISQGKRFLKFDEAIEKRSNGSGTSNEYYIDRTTGGIARLSIHYLVNIEDPPPLPAYTGDPRAGSYPDPARGWYGALSIGRQVGYLGGQLAWAMLVGVLAATFRRTCRRERLAAAIGLVELAVVSMFLACVALDHRNFDDRLFSTGPGRIGLFIMLASVAVLFGCILAPNPQPRTGPRRCSACSYDLTGNESGVCPECGTVAGVRVV